MFDGKNNKKDIYTLRPFEAIDRKSNYFLKLNDVLYDLLGNAFKVAGFEMRRKKPEADYDDSMGILLEPLGKYELSGYILATEPIKVNFLFCSDPLYPHKVDGIYREEFLSASQNYNCTCFSYEDLLEDRLTFYGKKISGLTIYRGWMMKPAMYRRFYQLLAKQQIYLINTPKEYENYHLLPNWYTTVAGFTAETVWTQTAEIDELLKLSRKLSGKYILKDYVKSRKQEWYDACFIENIKDERVVKRIANNFKERQGTEMVGGFVLRKFVDLIKNGYHPQSQSPIYEEYRVFVYAGHIMTIDNYWRQTQSSKLTSDEINWVKQIATQITSNFTTIDLARKTDGTLMIMELGDGQVSGLQQLTATEFYQGFAKLF